MYTADSLAKKPNSTLVKLTTSFCVCLCIVVIIYSRDILIIGFAIFGVLLALEGYLAAKFYNGVILRLFCGLMGILTIGSVFLGTYTLMGEKAQCGDETLNYDQCVEGVRILGYTTLFAGTFFFGFTTFVTIYFIRLLPAIKEHFWAEEDLLQMCYENMETQKEDQPIPEVESDESASSPQGFIQQSIELAEFH